MHLLRFGLWLLLFALSATLSAQVSFEAVSNARQITLNGVVEVTFNLKNGQGINFQPPSFDDFVVMSGPSTSLRTTIVNGQKSSEMGYTYLLKPKRTGRLVIGNASIKVADRLLRTNSITVEVVEESKNAGEAEPYFFRTVPSATQAYLGQQVLLDYKLYLLPQLRKERYGIADESDYAGFFPLPLNWYRNESEVIGGVQYTAWTLKRMALFPQRTGKLTIESMNLQAEIRNQNDPSFGFFRSPGERIALSSDPVTIEVLPMPEGAPDDFTGAVGQFQFSGVVDRRMLTTDDALTLRLTITGNGDLKRVGNPVLRLSDSLDVYEPSVQREENFDYQGRVRGEKVVEYLITPLYPGKYEIPATFTYFDPDSTKYITVATGPFPVEVRPGKNIGRKPDRSTADADQARKDIRSIKLRHEAYNLQKSFAGSPVFWSLWGSPLALLLGFLGFRRWQSRRGEVDPEVLRRQRARKAAQLHLQNAHHHLEQNQARAFFDEVSRASLGYVSDKLHIEPSRLSKPLIRERLTAAGVEPPLIERFLQILQTCEMALFAGQDDPARMRSTYEEAEGVISELEGKL